MAPVRVAAVGDIPPGSMAAFDVDGTEVLVANCDGELLAINNICSHAYAELSDGELDTDDCSVTCPVHAPPSTCAPAALASSLLSRPWRPTASACRATTC